MISHQWRGHFNHVEINALHAEGFAHAVRDDDWVRQVNRHSLGWVCARDGDELVGFVNVAWDGAGHAFVLDTLVTERSRKKGIGSQVVRVAIAEARSAGCEWLHVDFEDHLRHFYLETCGFTSTGAGLFAL